MGRGLILHVELLQLYSFGEPRGGPLHVRLFFGNAYVVPLGSFHQVRPRRVCGGVCSKALEISKGICGLGGGDPKTLNFYGGT